jgi:SnoaL-like domain
MRKITLFLLICLFFFGIPLSSYGQNISIFQRLKIEKEIDSVFHSFVTAAEKFDIEKLTQAVDDRYNAGFITGGIYYSGFNTLMDNLKINSQGLRNQTITIQKEKISVIAENIVILTVTGVTEVKTEDGNSFSAMFFWSFVFEKLNNNWKVIQSHQSGIRQ